MLIAHDDKKVLELKAYFEREMPEMSVDTSQTDSDVDKDVVSFLFHEKTSSALGWKWRLKITGEALANRQPAEIIRALGSQDWNSRLRQAPEGGVFVLKNDMRLEGPIF